MHEVFHGLTNRPFPSVPSPDTFFPAEPIENARQTLLRTIERAQGPALLIGPSGTGKSLLLTMLEHQFRSRFRVVTLANTKLCSRRALLQNILFELKLPYRDMEEGELRLSLIDALEPSEVCPHGLLLLVDEAHTLPVQLLEELRMITNLVRDDQPRVRLVLAGGAKLEERLADPALESLNQRVAARCYLEPFTAGETRQYVEHQIRWAGGHSEQVFDEDSFSAVWAATDGVPRLVNQLCDHALILSAAYEIKPIGRAGIEEAWADLQQLPTPWHSDENESEATVIEFGSLDDDDDSDLPELARFEDSQPSALVRRDDSELPDDDDTENVLDIQDASHTAQDDLALPLQMTAPEPVVNQPHPMPYPSTDDRTDEIFGTFEEEELVLDRFASFDSEIWNDRPKVRSEESRVISDALADAARVKSQPTAAGPTSNEPAPIELKYRSLDESPETPENQSAAETSPDVKREPVQLDIKPACDWDFETVPSQSESDVELEQTRAKNAEQDANGTLLGEFQEVTEFLVEVPAFQLPLNDEQLTQLDNASALPIGPQWGVWVQEAASLDSDGELSAEWVDDLRIVEYNQADAASDPVVPDDAESAEEIESPVAGAVEARSSVPLWSSRNEGDGPLQDDRDLIVMEEDQFQARTKQVPAGRAHREDYSRLFGKLRRNE